jgi:membrane-associated phospholipid phosphatase
MAGDKLSSALPWRLPLVALLLALTVWATDTNRSLFLALNGTAPLLPADLLLAITLMGNALAVAALIAGSLARRPRMIWAAVLAAPLGMLFVRGLKPLVALPRPAAVLPADAITIVGPMLKMMSFPSGHATTAFVFAAVVHALSDNRRSKVLALAIAITVAASRVVVGAHWPLDVLVAAGGGWVSGYVGAEWSKRLAWTAGERGRLGAALIVAAAAIGLMLMHYDLPGEAAMGWLLAAGALICAASVFRPYAVRVK